MDNRKAPVLIATTARGKLLIRLIEGSLDSLENLKRICVEVDPNPEYEKMLRGKLLNWKKTAGVSNFCQNAHAPSIPDTVWDGLKALRVRFYEPEYSDSAPAWLVRLLQNRSRGKKQLSSSC
jgi:hypothetical protein